MNLSDVFTLAEADPCDIVAAGTIEPGELLAQWVARPEWMDRAACRGENTELFFPRRGVRSLAEVRALCAECPVHAACLRYALDDPELLGVWGGTTATERRQIRRAAG